MTQNEDSGEVSACSRFEGPTIKRVFGFGVLVPLLRSVARRQVRAVNPVVVTSGLRVETLADLALKLAANEHDDQAAVSQLSASVGRHRSDLRKAVSLIRMRGYPEEFRGVDRAIRLLESTESGDRVEPPAPSKEELFSEVDELYSMPVEEAYERLQESVPNLRLLEEQVIQSSTQDHDDDALWGQLLTGLKPLLGSAATTDDLLLRSHAAHNIARLYIAKKAGLIDQILYD